MGQTKVMTEKEIYESAIQTCYPDEDDREPESYPELINFSSVMFYRFLPHPKIVLPPEFVYYKLKKHQLSQDNDAHRHLTPIEWNLIWESAQLRFEVLGGRLHEDFKWIEELRGHNVYFLPISSFHRYDAYAPLFHLLPINILSKWGLPALKRGLWPMTMPELLIDHVIPRDFDSRLSNAFAEYIWPLIDSRSRMSAYSKTEPIRLLAHNLDFWLPYIYQVAENRISSLGHVPCDDEEQSNLIVDANGKVPSDWVVNRPIHGGEVWIGERDAWAAAQEMVELADREGKLRSLIDAIRSNRVEDDFSECWSFVKEDFERKIHKKRNKISVKFVELNDTVPVHGPESEILEDLLWEDFMALLDAKERKIVVCLRNGPTKMAKISERLGYANHSPVSKALARIRGKAKEYFDLPPKKWTLS
jgi:hypothetical protein